MKNNFFPAKAFGLVFIGITATLPVMATENGQSMYPNGTENFMVNVVPPQPGFYGMVYGNHYEASTLRDNQGNKVALPDFKVKADVLAARGIWVTNQKALGGGVALHAIVPLVHLDATTPAGRQSKKGVGDITVGAGLAFHHSEKLHSLAGIDVFAPTGSYDKHDIANIGKNHWGLEPFYGVSYVDPNGFNGDIKFGYTFNGRNKDTDYTSGDEFHFDYAAGWGLGNGWTAGVSGYYYQQVTDDKLGGKKVADQRGRALSIGPSIKYDNGKGWFATLKVEREMEVKNRSEGTAVWFKTTIPL